ncbi:MAG TPA: nuclear transport factor 2 family protein [Gammaproteobacteria bacterium]
MSSRSSASKVAGAAVRAFAAAAALSLSSAPAPAQQVTMETLLDRIQIEDLLTRYYYDLAQGESHALSEYFTEDALLDVDGTIARGREEIAALYERPDSDEDSASDEPRPHNHMLLTNPVIEVHGDIAIAHVIWTGVMNEGVGKPPRLYEQGREDTELVKRDGKWLISRRYISSDSGLPDRFDATYKPRDNPLGDR